MLCCNLIAKVITLEAPLLPKDENERLQALKKYKILDTLPEDIFDDFTSIASQICGTPIALITLIDEDRQWFKSKLGINLSQTERDVSFCGHAILAKELFEIPDTVKDTRFVDNPLVTGNPDVRYYAGMPLITTSGHALGTLCVIDHIPRQMSAEQRIALEKLAKLVTSQIEHREAIIEMAYISTILENTGEIAKIGGWELDLITKQLRWTKEIYAIHELEFTNLPSLEDAINFYSPEARPLIRSAVNNAIEHGTAWDLEVPFITAKSNKIWVRSQGSAIMQADKAIKLQGAFQDITERKKSQIDIAWLNRALQMLSKCNELVIKMTNEKSLIAEICRIAVEIGGYRMAWVGYAENDDYKSITPKAYAGYTNDFLDNINLSWSEHNVRGLGPGGRTIRYGKPIVVEDLALDETYPVKDAAEKQGYRSLISLPLKNKSDTFGILSMYSSEVRTFAQDEVNLLENLTDNLAAGIINIRTEKERYQLQSAILSVANAVSTNIQGVFFQQLLTSMLNVIGADAGYISQYISLTPRKARTVAVQVDNQLMDNYEFVIPQTLVDTMFAADNIVIVAEQATENYANLSMMKYYKYQAFAGLKLLDSNNMPLGIIFVFFKEPLHQQSQMQTSSLLKVFATRTAGELERLKAEMLMREQASLLNKTHDAIVVSDLNHQITFWNAGAEALYGWTAAEAIGQSIDSLLKDDQKKFQLSINKLMKVGEWSGELIEHDKNGNALTIESHWTLVNDELGQPKSIFMINLDISNRKIAEEEIRQLAFYDPLTQIPNRRLLLDRLEKALINARRKKQFGTLIFIDLDNFKVLNDTLGHDKGDLLLKEIANRLKQSVRDCDTVARFGGDEFVMMIEDLSSDKEQAKILANSIGEKILFTLNHTFDFDGYLHANTPSIGITLFGQETKNIAELIKQADVAMYQSKAQGRNRLSFFQ